MDIETGLLLPAVVQAVTVMVFAYIMGGSRFISLKTGKVNVAELRKTGKWPGRLGVMSDSYDNQFQVPQLFYFICIVLTLLGEVNALNVGLAWAFVATRLFHMIWHNTKNVIIVRFLVFVLSGTILSVMILRSLFVLL